MTYLGRTNKNNKLKAEESFPISEHGYTSGKLLDGTECQLLLHRSASKSFMSKSFYMRCKLLHSLPTFASKTQRIQVGNGQCVSVLFIILVIIDVHGHRFEIYTFVLEIHKNIDLVLGIKNVFILEGVINSRDCCFKFLNRSVPIFPEDCTILRPSEQKLIKVKAPFIDETSGLVIVKMLDGFTCSTLDEIGTCPNIEVEINVTDNSPIFIRPYHIREEDKAFIDKEMKQLCYMGILKEGSSVYSSPIMLISRKLTKDKRVVTDFRYLNVRIAKNNLGISLS